MFEHLFDFEWFTGILYMSTVLSQERGNNPYTVFALEI